MNKWLQGLVLVVACYATFQFTDNKWEAKWNKHLAQDNTDRLAYEQKQRDLEQRYNTDREALELDMQARMDLLRSAIAGGAERANSLQEQLNTTRGALQRARKDAELAGINTGAAEAALVLSDLYRASIEELRRVAGTADEWYEQAAGCNRFYQQVKEAPK